jgi:hypothetical protein
LTSLEARLARLEALQAIDALKARYARLADAKYTSSHQRVPPDEWRRIATLQAACFTEDAEWDGGAEFGGTLRGRAALTEWFERSPWRFALHFYVAPEIELVDDVRAQGSWRLWQVAVPADGSFPVVLAGTTRESYGATSGQWLIERMRFEGVHTLDLGKSPVELRCILPGQHA